MPEQEDLDLDFSDLDEEFDPDSELLSIPSESKPLPTADDEAENAETALNDEETEEFVTSIFVGRREKDVTILGHVIKIQTLTIDQELQVATLIKPWEGTQGYTRAFMSAVAAASIVKLDGKTFYMPTNDEDKAQIVNRKFEKVLTLYPIFVDQIYSAFTELESDTAKKLMVKLGKSKG